MAAATSTESELSSLLPDESSYELLLEEDSSSEIDSRLLSLGAFLGGYAAFSSSIGGAAEGFCTD